jgi:prepilin-type N-terminal cleavage/methylation domain-containing protein
VGKAFTLIEVMVVLLVVSIAAGAVTLCLAGPKRRAELDDVVGGVVQFDLLARQYALRHGKAVQLVFDLDGGKLLRVPGPKAREAEFPQYALPGGCRLAALVLAERKVTRGRAAIWCSDRGLTPTYAVRIDARVGRRWVVLAGLTGQATEFGDDTEIEQAIALLAGDRADAD